MTCLDSKLWDVFFLGAFAYLTVRSGLDHEWAWLVLNTVLLAWHVFRLLWRIRHEKP
jgi:hypothetical protein